MLVGWIHFSWIIGGLERERFRRGEQIDAISLQPERKYELRTMYLRRSTTEHSFSAFIFRGLVMVVSFALVILIFV